MELLNEDLVPVCGLVLPCSDSAIHSNMQFSQTKTPIASNNPDPETWESSIANRCSVALLAMVESN